MTIEEKLQEKVEVERKRLFQFTDFVPFYGFFKIPSLLESVSSLDISKKRRVPLESRYPQLSTLIECTYLITAINYQIGSSFLMAYLCGIFEK